MQYVHNRLLNIRLSENTYKRTSVVQRCYEAIISSENCFLVHPQHKRQLFEEGCMEGGDTPSVFTGMFAVVSHTIEAQSGRLIFLR